MTGYAAVVLAGGAARRMGGVDKPARPVGGRPMLHRVLAAVADADQRIVVGPSGPVPDGVRTTREEPPGGGPVAAIAAGLALLDPGTTTVALLAADLPLLTAAAVTELRRALDTPAAEREHDRAAEREREPAAERASTLPPRGPTVALACYVDGDGRRQQLCAVWRLPALRAALDRLAATRGGTLDGAPVRGLLTGVAVREVSWSGSGPPPWFDCDTDEDVRRAEEWSR
ncbi:molybdopterin-guanine dinucleotide biosynthesis protein A [Micromonospora sp. HB375]|uniref:molybdenum cofactor guanylyltransferase n=1 Tax=unclassified Micromonospora TaxID=2617518 RepID=UPI001AE2A0E2|nr:MULTISPECIES: NTP transferase domain-containing protein [unclassified Micromonospora]MBP1786303.1 molybdopterin-guanine dinucleotide biosynthesis protein A [Micromonospora sp. HB375]MDH6471948.1 molybdopterin-guanine dinucleotide biosynthesis protein A [Micromonospora sp. H404/HB375]